MTANDPHGTATFASSCEAALFLKQRDLFSFASLDEHTTLQIILDPMATPLYDRWYEHQWNVLCSATTSFEQFAEWIQRPAGLNIGGGAGTDIVKNPMRAHMTEIPKNPRKF